MKKTILNKIPRGSKIICECSDGSQYLIFDHLDGLYSYCKTERGGVIHLHNMQPLKEMPDKTYILCQ